MKKNSFNFLFVLLAILTLYSCSKEEKGEILTFDRAYDELVMAYTSIDDISIITGVKPSDLVDMRYNLINVPEGLEETVRKLRDAYKDKDEKEIEKLRIESKNYSIPQTKKKIDRAAYRDITTKRNEYFMELEPSIVADYIYDNINDYFEEKYTLISVIPNTWNYFTKSEDEFVKDFLSDFNSNELVNKSEKNYVDKVNQYKDNLSKEYAILFGESIDIPDFHIIESQENVDLDGSVKELVIQRTQSQIKDLSWDIFWDLIVTLIIGWIFAFIVDLAIDSARDKAIKKAIGSLGWNKKDGIIKNLFMNGIRLAGVHDEYSEEKKRIKAKYGRIKVICNTAVLVVSFIVAWWVIIQPQIRMEMELNSAATQNIIESSNTLNMNLCRVIELYINK